VGALRPRPLVLDTGALIAYERSDRRLVRLLELADEICVPATVVGQAWRNPARQARLARLLRSREVQTEDLDLDLAKAAGHLCGAAGTDDVVDATVVLAARARGAVVVTSDVDDIRCLDPSLTIASC
jgi:predicted nucleic acid-binding protein